MCADSLLFPKPKHFWFSIQASNAVHYATTSPRWAQFSHSFSCFPNRFMYQMARSFTVNVVSSGSPSRIRMVLRISLGMTTRPKSSMRRTIPVAFMSFKTFPFRVRFTLEILSAPREWLCWKIWSGRGCIWRAYCLAATKTGAALCRSGFVGFSV